MCDILKAINFHSATCNNIRPVKPDNQKPISFMFSKHKFGKYKVISRCVIRNWLLIISLRIPITNVIVYGLTGIHTWTDVC